MAYSQLLLVDGSSRLALSDDVSVLLTDAIQVIDPDTSPYRRFYNLDARVTYALDATDSYHLDARADYALDARASYRADTRRTYRSR